MTLSRRRNRPSAALALSLALIAGTATPPARAQEPAPAEGEASEGRPFDGYFLTAAFAGFVLFIVCKSARRS